MVPLEWASRDLVYWNPTYIINWFCITLVGFWLVFDELCLSYSLDFCLRYLLCFWLVLCWVFHFNFDFCLFCFFWSVSWLYSVCGYICSWLSIHFYVLVRLHAGFLVGFFVCFIIVFCYACLDSRELVHWNLSEQINWFIVFWLLFDWFLMSCV